MTDSASSATDGNTSNGTGTIELPLDYITSTQSLNSSINFDMQNNCTKDTAALQRKSSLQATKTTTKTIEKQRKSSSASRQKKFHRHFNQVDADEDVINCNFKFLFSFHFAIELNFELVFFCFRFFSIL